MENGIRLAFLRTLIGRAWLPVLFLLAATAAVKAGDFAYTTNSDNTITITGYNGPSDTVVIPSIIEGKTVASIGDRALMEYASLTSVTIPASVTSIKDNAFLGCTTMAAITVDAGNSVYSSVDGVLFNKSQTTLIRYPGGKVGSYTIPHSVTSIGGLAFCRCDRLTSITIPNTVTSIGIYAFAFCPGLTSITIPNSVTTILRNAFQDCDRLTGVYFQGNVHSLGSSVLKGADNATVYYLPGTTDWGPTFCGRPTAVWKL